MHGVVFVPVVPMYNTEYFSIYAVGRQPHKGGLSKGGDWTIASLQFSEV